MSVLMALVVACLTALGAVVALTAIPALGLEVARAFRQAGLASGAWSLSWFLTILSFGTFCTALGFAECAWLTGNDDAERVARGIAGWGVVAGMLSFLPAMGLTRYADVPGLRRRGMAAVGCSTKDKV